MANILHRSGYVNDAIVATSYAMERSPTLVVGHFNMANLFAAKVNNAIILHPNLRRDSYMFDI